VIAGAACRGRRREPGPPVIPGDSGQRILVEVLNASGESNLARTATRVLRGGGIDVVGFGNAGNAVGVLDSTRIVVRRGTAATGATIRQVLKVGRVSLDVDSARLLDASVYLGRDFHPRLQFHP